MIKCPVCETQFEPVMSGGKQSKYCSKKCRVAYHAARLWLGEQMVTMTPKILVAWHQSGVYGGD